MMQQSAGSMTWRVHPARRHRGRALMGAAWIVALALTIYATTYSFWWTVFSIVFLIAALNRFFFPSTFEVNDQGVTARYPFRTRRLRWDEMKRFDHDAESGFLWADAPTKRSARTRGLQIWFDTDRGEVVRTIRARLDQGRAA